MKCRRATALALFAILLQTAQPLMAAMAPASTMTQTAAMAQPCDGAATAYTASNTASHHTTRSAPMRTGGHNMGCCCHGPWSCGGPCGMLALGPRPVMPALPPLAHRWLTTARPQLAAAHLLELLRPPTDS